MPHRPVSEAGLQLLMSFEGCRHYAARLADGRWTIGYGHTRSARKGAVVTQADARALLIYDLQEISEALETLVLTPLNQNQFDALACFAFNIGLDNFRQSAVLQLVNAGAHLAAAHAFEQWREAEIDGEALVIGGLVRRRAAEKALFLAPPAGWQPVPTPLVQPRLDRAADIRALLNGFVEVKADLMGGEARIELDAPNRPTPRPEPDTAEPLPAPAAAEMAIEPEPEPLPARVERPGETWLTAPVEDSVPPPPQAPPLESPTVKPPTASLRDQIGHFDYETTIHGQGASWSWFALAALGVVIFAVSIIWAVRAHGPRGLFSPQVIGTLLALVGVACVVSAVYSLVHRYVEQDE